jgi:hypothetical protein
MNHQVLEAAAVIQDLTPSRSLNFPVMKCEILQLIEFAGLAIVDTESIYLIII